jgi:hypothetical protein
MNGLLDILKRISAPPSEEQAFNAWIEAMDAPAFLRSNAQSGDLLMHATSQHTYMHAVLVPSSRVDPPNIDDLLSWDCNADSSWGITVSPSKSPAVYISAPLDAASTETLHGAEQLVFSRHFEGRLGDKGYYEVSQKFLHIFDLHFLAERNAYCRLDKHGDVEDVVRIIPVPATAGGFSGVVVIFERDTLDEYLALARS